MVKSSFGNDFTIEYIENQEKKDYQWSGMNTSII